MTPLARIDFDRRGRHYLLAIGPDRGRPRPWRRPWANGRSGRWTVGLGLGWVSVWTMSAERHRQLLPHGLRIGRWEVSTEDAIDWIAVRLADPRGPLGRRLGPALAEALWRATGLIGPDPDRKTR